MCPQCIFDLTSLFRKVHLWSDDPWPIENNCTEHFITCVHQTVISLYQISHAHMSDGGSWSSNLRLFIMSGLLTPGRQRVTQPEQTCYSGHSLLHKADDYIWDTGQHTSTTSFMCGRLLELIQFFFFGSFKTNLACVFSPLPGHSGKHRRQHQHCNRKSNVWAGWY